MADSPERAMSEATFRRQRFLDVASLSFVTV